MLAMISRRNFFETHRIIKDCCFYFIFKLTQHNLSLAEKFCWVVGRDLFIDHIYGHLANVLVRTWSKSNNRRDEKTFEGFSGLVLISLSQFDYKKVRVMVWEISNLGKANWLKANKTWEAGKVLDFLQPWKENPWVGGFIECFMTFDIDLQFHASDK